MSNAVLKGNASGTGTVTLETPNTNSDRTISLPDADGTMVYANLSGNVGIGTDSPAAKLVSAGSSSTVYKALLLRNSDGTTGSSATIDFEASAGTQGDEGSMAGRIAGVRTGSGTSGALAFSTTNAGVLNERMRITSAGDVLVGKTAGDTSNAGVWIYNQNSNQGRLNIIKTASGTLNSIANYHSGTYVGGVDYSNTATSFPTSSDVRLKKDIVDAPSAIDKVNNIRIVSHGWKNDDSHVEYGVVAQELEPIAPQAVKKGDDGETIEQTWGVDYSKLVPMLTKAIQELKAELDATKAEVAALKGAE
jgi:hypothetical protein